MKTFLRVVLSISFVVGLTGRVSADESQATAVVDKAIKAIGGEEKLTKASASSMKAKGTISFGGNDSQFTIQSTVQGLDQYQSKFEGEFGGNKVQAIAVISGDKGWRKFGDFKQEMDKDATANEKRTVYLQVVPRTLLPLKGKEFKVESGGESKVGDKPVAILKVTGPDGKDFTLAFDKESGLPVQTVAKVLGFQGEEFTQETNFSDYKDLGGIKVATKIESKRDGETFIKQEITEFTVLEKVDPKTFAEPE
jgi:hypothetical protein